MGSGYWTATSFVTNSIETRGFTSMDEFKAASAQQLYRSHSLDPMLDPRNKIRECCDSDEHPNTKPVILGLDVTGSMGPAAEAVAKQLNDIMAEIYKTTTDVQFMTCAIGDLSYDDAPLQVSQFESDIRIAEQLEKVYFERGGGGNQWESYTQAWYYGLYRTKLDCYDNRGRRGLIITIGDEPLNPYLPAGPLSEALGIPVQDDVDTNDLYKAASKKFDIWHIGFNDNWTCYRAYKSSGDMKGWEDLLGDHFVEATEQALYQVIADIVEKSFNGDTENSSTIINENGEISW